MKQVSIHNGTRTVHMTSNDGINWDGRLYVNRGETATRTNFRSKGIERATKKAKQVLGL